MLNLLKDGISYTIIYYNNKRSTLEVKEDGTIVFEGVDDGFETTLTL